MGSVDVQYCTPHCSKYGDWRLETGDIRALLHMYTVLRLLLLLPVAVAVGLGPSMTTVGVLAERQQDCPGKRDTLLGVIDRSTGYLR